MQQFSALWASLDMRRRAFLLGGIAALGMILLILSRMASAPTYALLYSGIDPAAAGEVITAIESRGIAYQVRGESIYVAETERDALRMSLAGEGLPALGAQGYELLDSLSGFGTTSQMFDAAYWRAREGELARTITASPRIRAARVHLATAVSDPFQPQSEPSASVSIRPAAGGITSAHAQALRYLVASAVPGLIPENVSVIDTDSGRVIGMDDLQSPAGDAAGRADALRSNIERLLTARVGPGNAVVEVSVELVSARETVFERLIDPDSRVVIGTESEESSSTSRDAANGAVTVASNLPEGDGAEGEGSSSNQDSETRQRITYDISETQREIEREPGSLRRISVAVLVNAVTTIGADGVPVTGPRTTEELASLEALVQSAIGFDEARGDQVTIQSMQFETVPTELAEGEGAGSFADRIDFMSLARIAGLVTVALIIAFGVLRPMARSTATRPENLPALAPAQAPALAGIPAPQPQTATSFSQQQAPGLEQQVVSQSPTVQPGIALPPQQMASLPDQTQNTASDTNNEAGNLPAVADRDEPSLTEAEITDDPVLRLRRLIEEREDETVEILRSWMEEDETA